MQDRTITTSNPILSASTLSGDKVCNALGEDLGKVEDFMLDLSNGRIRYAVLSFGGFLGMGDKLFAVPPEALRIDTENNELILDVERERLENAPGFDKDHWPETSDHEWERSVYEFYGSTPYWE
ncbi:MAG TPA: PRC-barrel domain-containing protein [Gemmatimonadota bacterium]|nr:PRC-barrel domain-containing protein [Gemmatimonadota bacterium]